jgi:hypothetical protein
VFFPEVETLLLGRGFVAVKEQKDAIGERGQIDGRVELGARWRKLVVRPDIVVGDVAAAVLKNA